MVTTPVEVDWSAFNASRRKAWLGSFVLPLVLAPFWYLLFKGASATPLQSLIGLVASLLVVTCAYTDLRFRKIPNWATYGGFLWALGINIFVSTFAGPARSETGVLPEWNSSFPGGVGLLQSLFGGGTCFFIMLMVYSITGGGAGDVKLAAALGALLGVRDGLFILALTYILAGVVLLVWTIWTKGPLCLIRAFAKQIGSVLLPVWVAPPEADEKTLLARPVPLGAFFAAATFAVLFGLKDHLS